jgi:tetratricopeptide (TPR) repeat protein
MAEASSRIDMLLGFIRQRPEDPFPRYALAMEYKNTGRLEEARGIFTELMATSPGYTASYLHAGNVLLSLGQFDQARSVYERGITVCAGSGDSHARGELESALGSLPG